MKLLLDTNVLIPLEPTGPGDVSTSTPFATALASYANSGKCELWLHPAQQVDLRQDRDTQRHTVRTLLFEKYPKLSFPSTNAPSTGTNDWVDAQLIDALAHNAVDFLVTEDIRLSKLASRRACGEKVLTLSQAVEMIRDFTEVGTQPVPNIEITEAYRLDGDDPFWESFQADYPGFAGWLAKCQLEHRTCFVLRGETSNGLIGVAIVNHEQAETRGCKTLKICSLKIGEEHNGRRLGELLLKQVFKYAYEQSFDSLFVTAFPKQQQLISLLTEFGFVEEDVQRANGEVQLSKSLARQHIDDPAQDALQHHILKGPVSVNLSVSCFLVPIQPQFHSMLFPELQAQASLMPSREGHANAIRKAYLCRSNTRCLPKGSLLLFYRSEDARSVGCVGVVEDTMRSKEAGELGAFVLPRTVYSEQQIDAMSRQGDVLAIRFRQSLAPVSPAIGWQELSTSTGLRSAPQSIVKLKEEQRAWLTHRLALS